MESFEKIRNKYIREISTKKLIEWGAVFNFLKNNNFKNIEERQFNINPDEPSDITYKNQKFQVTTAPADVNKVVGVLKKKNEIKEGNAEGKCLNIGGKRVPMWSSGGSIKEELNDFIIKPIQVKRKQYGVSEKSIPYALKDIILLIYSNNTVICPFNESVMANFKNEYKDYLKTSGFKEIYLTDPKINLKIYP